VGDLLIVQFHIQRIPGVIKKPEDVDTKKIDHSVELSHLSCITPHTFPHLIVPASIGTTFHHSVYFHPNVRTDGWLEFITVHQKARDEYSSLPIDDGKKKEKKKEKKKLQIKVPFPQLPLHPSFWEHPVRGSAINLWPPRFFDDWIASVAGGIPLSLDPAPATTTTLSNSFPVAGPSNRQRSPSIVLSPGRDSILPTQPLPSPPRDGSEEGSNFDADEELRQQIDHELNVMAGLEDDLMDGLNLSE